MTSQPESFEGKPSSFFMFCENDFATKLSIPKAFAEKHSNFLLQKTMQLRTSRTSRRWKVKIKNIDGDFFIVDGWSDFVKDNNLVNMMLLVFRISSSAILHVTILGHDSCSQPPAVGVIPTPSCSQPPPVEVIPTPPAQPNPRGRALRFVKTLKDHNITNGRMDIPKEFAVATGIAMSNLVELEDERERKWPVAITDRKIGMYSLTGRWIEFLRGNNLQVGNILLFEFVPDYDNVLKVTTMEEGAGRELLEQAKGGGFLG